MPTVGSDATVAPTPVVLILFENHDYWQVVGNIHAPYLNDTLMPTGRTLTQYFAVTHPSLPNYLALTSGATDGCDTDKCTTTLTQNNIFHQLNGHGMSWNALNNSMPSPCYRYDTTTYKMHHNPAVFYTNLQGGACAAYDVAFPWQLPTALPDFTFVTPNICQDMHSCSVGRGDIWLSKHVPEFLALGATVIVTFDEGTTAAGGGGHVICVEAGPGIPVGAKNAMRFNHYGLLAGIEQHFGLPLLRQAANNTPVPV